MLNRAVGSRHARSSASVGLLSIASSIVVGSGAPAGSCGCLSDAARARSSKAPGRPSVSCEPGCGATPGGFGPECCGDPATRAEDDLVSSSPGRGVPGCSTCVIARYDAPMTTSTALPSPRARLTDRRIRCAADRRLDHVHAWGLALAHYSYCARTIACLACEVSLASVDTLRTIALNT